MECRDSSVEGLTTEEAEIRKKIYGTNEMNLEKQPDFFITLRRILSEPMFILLWLAATVYFFLGEPVEGIVMVASVVMIVSIDIFQEWKTDKTLKALRDLSVPRVRVVRDGQETVVSGTELVPGDLVLLAEGARVPADGIILRAENLAVDESLLTGESESVSKSTEPPTTTEEEYLWKRNRCYAGTLVVRGTARIVVEKTGLATAYGKIGAGIVAAERGQTPLQKQTRELVKFSGSVASLLFLAVGGLTWWNLSSLNLGERISASVLSAVTIAMAMIPEEFPVIFTVFLSMGAWRLARKKSLIRHLPAVETLGAVSVLCVDKTGTITKNQMHLEETWIPCEEERVFFETLFRACHLDPYDPMEKALLAGCGETGISTGELMDAEVLKSYPFSNQLKIMGHVWQQDEAVYLAVKGSPEKILEISNSPHELIQATEEIMEAMTKKGLRVIGVGKQVLSDRKNLPDSLTDFTPDFLGLVGLADPPKEFVEENIRQCLDAGIRLVMITGDHGKTASSIAERVGIPLAGRYLTGQELDKMTEEEVAEAVQEYNIFARVVPEHKLRIVRALKESGAIVAMTGDGVNDAPALKFADIGIAMGMRGTEVSREAADMILMDDNFSTIVETIRDGRRIYDNIRKAVGYIFTIHIPIALSALMAPLLGISPASVLLLPFHVVLLELVIDPTCSIVLERQPAERGIMERKPRNPTEKIVTGSVILKSMFQGLAVFVVFFGSYLYVMEVWNSVNLARSMALTIIILANIFLVLVNLSQEDAILKSLIKMKKDKVFWGILSLTLMLVGLILYSPLHVFLRLTPLSVTQIAMAVLIAALGVFWYEGVKWWAKKK